LHDPVDVKRQRWIIFNQRWQR